MTGNHDVKGIARAALIYDYLTFCKPFNSASLSKHGKLIIVHIAEQRHVFQVRF